MKFELIQFKISEKELLSKMLYVYLKEIDPQQIENIALANFTYKYLDSYWQETNRIPIKIQFGTKVLGFALINDYTKNSDFKAERSIAEFYIKPQFRLKSIGKLVAFEIFDEYKGKWEVRQEANNHSAYKFWNKIIAEYTGNSFKEVIFEKEILQLFHSRQL